MKTIKSTSAGAFIAKSVLLVLLLLSISSVIAQVGLKEERMHEIFGKPAEVRQTNEKDGTHYETYYTDKFEMLVAYKAESIVNSIRYKTLNGAKVTALEAVAILTINDRIPSTHEWRNIASDGKGLDFVYVARNGPYKGITAEEYHAMSFSEQDEVTCATGSKMRAQAVDRAGTSFCVGFSRRPRPTGDSH